MARNLKIILKIILIAAEACLVLMFLLPMFIGIVNVGAQFGLVMSVLLLAATVFWRQLCRLVRKISGRRAGKIILIIILAVFILLVIYAAVLSGLMINAACNSPRAPDTVIVLGCKVQPSGNPSVMLNRRIEAAYGYLEENPDIICVVSGGKGSDEPVSEAEAMKKALVDKGIDETRIIAEDKSESTRQNIEFSLKILEEKGMEVTEAAIVTDGFHQFRAGLIAKEFDIVPTAVSAQTPMRLVAAYWLREWFALSHRFVFGS
ncbi:MAG: YdcF family protein [Firmicutes bacterium]|nr:YdcF family protein [[Eubacterium] siraeum]MCM1487974.1 YdcF family protein [Bacillota bacterium]